MFLLDGRDLYILLAYPVVNPPFGGLTLAIGGKEVPRFVLDRPFGLARPRFRLVTVLNLLVDPV